jgi:hypothetical protein
MTQRNVIRFEASDADASVEGDAALVAFQTAEGEVAVRMQRRVCALLYERIKLALEQPA